MTDEHLRQRLSEVTALNQVSLAVCTLRDLDSVLDIVLAKATEVMRAEASSLLLLEENGGLLRFHVARGRAARDLVSRSVRVGQGLVGHVAQTGRPLISNDPYADPRFDPAFDELTGFRTRSALTVPLTGNGQVTGVLQVINKSDGTPFDDGDRELLESFAAQANVALDNARLYTETKKMAEDLRVALEHERRLTIENRKMGAFVSRHLVDEISRSREQRLALGGKTVRATILFADIVGFTRLSESLDPQETVGFLNVYMTAMTEVIEAHRGVIDKLIGDGIMAVFTDQEGEDHALRAVRAGVAMQARVCVLRRQPGELMRLAPDLRIRVGINTGRMVAGNIGSLTRMDYTVIGDDVNVASRVEAACAPGSVFITASTFEEVKDEIAATLMEPITAKNRSQPVHVYAVDVDDTARPASIG